jgi:hypothetical protein
MSSNNMPCKDSAATRCEDLGLRYKYRGTEGSTVGSRGVSDRDRWTGLH